MVKECPYGLGWMVDRTVSMLLIGCLFCKYHEDYQNYLRVFINPIGNVMILLSKQMHFFFVLFFALICRTSTRLRTATGSLALGSPTSFIELEQVICHRTTHAKLSLCQRICVNCAVLRKGKGFFSSCFFKKLFV